MATNNNPHTKTRLNFTNGEVSYIYDRAGEIYKPIRTFEIKKTTKCFVYWIETNTNYYNNSHKVLRTKKFFCEYRNCEYFKDSLNSRMYADGTWN